MLSHSGHICTWEKVRLAGSGMTWYVCAHFFFLNLLKLSYPLIHSFQTYQIMLETVRTFSTILIHYLWWEYVQRSVLWDVLSGVPLKSNPDKAVKRRQSTHFTTDHLRRLAPQLPNSPILRHKSIRHNYKSQCWQGSTWCCFFSWMFLFIPLLYWSNYIFGGKQTIMKK